MNISQALEALRSGQTTAEKLVTEYFEKIEKSDINAYITLNKENAIARAKEIDAKGDYSAPLAGIPISVKDIICTKGVKTTAASKILENFVPPYSATVWEKLENAGAIMLGKTNCDEFAMGSSTENSAYGNTKNPRNSEYVPGGSSGGAAASVAGDLCMAAVGTDTGGSIRQPANFCGCVGLKVTYGRVSRYGVISYASSFDTIGPLANCVQDAAHMLNAMAGADPKDSTTPEVEVPDYLANIKANITGKKVGIPKEFFAVEGIDPEVKKAVEDAAEMLKKRGAIIEEVSLPLTEYAIPAYYLLVKAEASTNLARYDGVRFGQNKAGEDLTEMYKNTRGEFFGDEVKRAIMMGTFTLSSGYVDAYYKKAAAVRAKFKQDYDKAFEQVDYMMAPVAPTPAFKFGENIDDPLKMYLGDIFTVSINLAGIPSLAVPTAKIGDLPTGVQLMAKQFDEAGLLNIGWHLEQEAKFN
jgi:aspartyl-tRNA(Asn)/glutamyl-tRNA(Gln) amidotransferase subunit A